MNTPMSTPNGSRLAHIMLPDGDRIVGDDPDARIGVPAGELFEWAWLTAELADWLDRAGPATREEFGRHFDGFRSCPKTATFLALISERIAGLLDGNPGQP